MKVDDNNNKAIDFRPTTHVHAIRKPKPLVLSPCIYHYASIDLRPRAVVLFSPLIGPEPGDSRRRVAQPRHVVLQFSLPFFLPGFCRAKTIC